MTDSPEFGPGIWMFQQCMDRYAGDAHGPAAAAGHAAGHDGWKG